MILNIEISDFQRKVIEDLINRDEFLDMINAQILQKLNQIFTSSLQNLKNTWIVILKKDGIDTALEDEKLLEIIFAHSDYKDKKDRELEAQEERTARFDIQ